MADEEGGTTGSQAAPRWVQVVNAAGNYATGDMHSYLDVAGKADYRFTGWSAKIHRG